MYINYITFVGMLDFAGFRQRHVAGKHENAETAPGPNALGDFDLGHLAVVSPVSPEISGLRATLSTKGWNLRMCPQQNINTTSWWFQPL